MFERHRTWVILFIALLTAGLHAAALSADGPNTPTPLPGAEETLPAAPTSTREPVVPTATDAPTHTPTATAATRAVTPTATVLTPTATIAPATATPTPTAAALPPTATTVSPTAVAGTATLTPTHTAVPATPAATPSPTAAPDPAGYIAVLAGESTVSIGGEAYSEILVSLSDVDGAERLELVLRYDPQVVRFAGLREGDAAGAEVEATTVDKSAGRIVLAGRWRGAQARGDTVLWQKVAVVRWIGQREGKSVVAVDRATRVITAAGAARAPNAVYDGMVFCRPPGAIQGQVHLQGRSAHDQIVVVGVLSTRRQDRQQTDSAGRFAIATTHGEGFYALSARMPGYLTAESERPVKVTLDTVVDAGAVTLVGGDVNGDQAIDIRDVSYVAYHFDQYDPQADVNGDGVVDILDLTLVAGNFGQVGPTAWTLP